MRLARGTLTEKGTDSPWRDRPAAESLRLLREMRDGLHPDGAMALRARIDMASPNMNLRDPVLYRIRHAAHPRHGPKGCIHPLTPWAQPVDNAQEGHTPSTHTAQKPHETEKG